jgi:hypothetical protein
MNPYIKWVLLFIPNLVMLLLAVVLSPILPLFALGKDHLPKFLLWFDTEDNPLDGDAGFKSEHAPFKGSQSGVKQYINRVAWLLRNPAYGFGTTVLSFNPQGFELTSSSGTHPFNGGNDKEGLLKASAKNSAGQYAFQFLYVKHYSNGTTCFRVNLGWKITSYPGSVQYVCSISPYKGI